MFYIKWGTNQCEVSWLWGLVYYNGCQLCDIIVWFIIPMGTNVWYYDNCVVSWLWGIMELSGVIFSTGATGSMNIDGQTNMKPPIGFRTISQKCSNYCRCNSSGVKSNQWDNLTQTKSAFSTYIGKKKNGNVLRHPPPLSPSLTELVSIFDIKNTLKRAETVFLDTCLTKSLMTGETLNLNGKFLKFFSICFLTSPPL